MRIRSIYLDYTQGKCSLEVLKKEITSYAYYGFKKDKYMEAGDFIVSFIPIIEKVIEEYNSKLCQFDSYLNRRIEWFRLNLVNSCIKEERKERAYKYYTTLDCKNYLEISDVQLSYNPTKDATEFLKIKNGVIVKIIHRKRFLIFTLKSSRLLTDTHIEHIAPIIGETLESLRNKVETLNRGCEKRLKNRDYLVSRSNRLYIEIAKNHELLLRITDSEEKRTLKLRISEQKKRRDDIHNILTKRSYGPTNEEIAIFLKIPKGTVDSTLFYMKKNLSSILSNEIID